MKTLRLLPLVFAVAALHCGINPNDGTGSSTESITAMLYNQDGSPAKQAKVCFYRHHDDPRNNHAVDSTYTDNNGNYKKDLDTGTYNILATLDTNATFQDSVIVTEGDTTRPVPDTLKSLGSISGRIELQGTDDPRTVFVLFMGSNTFVRPTDLLGNFSATNMAKGKYPVTLLTTLDNYAVMDTSFLIRAGFDSIIPQPIVMNYTGIPVPKGLRIEYDTMKQIVTLYWNTPTTGRPLSGYNIYRKHQDSAITLLRADWTDTTYNDSTGIQDITYEYRVAAIDTNTTEGTRSAAVSVTVESAFIISDTILTIDSVGFPFSVQVDKNSNYVFADGIGTNLQSTKPAKIERYNTQGTLINSWDIPGGIEGVYIYNNIAINDSGSIFVITKDNVVLEYDTLGALQSQFQFPGTARGFAIYKDTLFIADRIAQKVSAYSTKGDSLFSWGSDGFGNGQFKQIIRLAVDSAGNVYVEDVGDIAFEQRWRIQAFQKTGTFLFSMDIVAGGGNLAICSNTLFAPTNNDGDLYAYETSGFFKFKYSSTQQTFNQVISNNANQITVFTWRGRLIQISRK
jgi:hypothetical protein